MGKTTLDAMESISLYNSRSFPVCFKEMSYVEMKGHGSFNVSSSVYANTWVFEVITFKWQKTYKF